MRRAGGAQAGQRRSRRQPHCSGLSAAIAIAKHALAPERARHLLLLDFQDFLDYSFEVVRQSPARKVRAKFPKVAEVANVVALAGLVLILPPHFFSGGLLDQVEGFQNGHAVFPSAADVINLAWPGIQEEFFRGSHDIEAMNVVADLLPLVPQNRVRLSGHRDFHQIRQESV